MITIPLGQARHFAKANARLNEGDHETTGAPMCGLICDYKTGEGRMWEYACFYCEDDARKMLAAAETGVFPLLKCPSMCGSVLCSSGRDP